MKLNQRLLVHIGPIPTSGGTPTEVTVMEFSPNERFVKLRPEPACKQPATCGDPTPEGYRNSCGKHQQKS